MFIVAVNNGEFLSPWHSCTTRNFWFWTSLRSEWTRCSVKGEYFYYGLIDIRQQPTTTVSQTPRFLNIFFCLSLVSGIIWFRSRKTATRRSSLLRITSRRLDKLTLWVHHLMVYCTSVTTNSILTIDENRQSQIITLIKIILKLKNSIN